MGFWDQAYEPSEDCDDEKEDPEAFTEDDEEDKEAQKRGFGAQALLCTIITVAGISTALSLHGASSTAFVILAFFRMSIIALLSTVTSTSMGLKHKSQLDALEEEIPKAEKYARKSRTALRRIDSSFRWLYDNHKLRARQYEEWQALKAR